MNVNSAYKNTPSNNLELAGGETISVNSGSSPTLTRVFFVPASISYDMAAITFNDGRHNTPLRIVVIDTNTIELLTNPLMIDKQPNTPGFITAK